MRRVYSHRKIEEHPREKRGFSCALKLLRSEIVYDVDYISWKVAQCRISEEGSRAEAQTDQENSDWLTRQVETALDNAKDRISAYVVEMSRMQTDEDENRDEWDIVLYMEYARQQGYVLITEMTDETKPVTRQSVAKVVSRMLKLPDTDIDMTNVADWDTTCPKCKEDIGKCYAYGIMSGYEDNTFRGRYPATKAEVIATMLNAKAYLNIAEEK